MSLVHKDDGVTIEALVENIDSIQLAQESLSTLATTDFELATMENPDELSIVESEDMHEVIVQGQDIDMDVDLEKMEIEKKQQSGLPPLRPLTIAPKPIKVPVQIKPVAGQQLLVLQGGTPGQQIKLLSSGQGLNLSNLTLAKPITIKTAHKTPSGMSIVQPKQIVMKKVVPKAGGKPQQIVVVQKTEPQPVKLVQSTSTVTTASPVTKTLTLAQAQQMGILSGTKIIPQSNKQIILNKSPPKTIKIVPQIKTPTKILPAPQTQATTTAVAKAAPQRLYLKPTTVPSTVLPNQIIQVAGAQTINAGQLHQINIPGKGMQYIKFVTTSEAGASSSGTTNATPIQANVIAKIATGNNTSAIKSGNVILSEVKTIPSKPQTIKLNSKSVTTTATVRPLHLNTTSQVVVVPANFRPRANQVAKVAIPAIKHTSSSASSTQLASKSAQNAQSSSSSDAVVPSSNNSEILTLESNGMRPRKPCNCTKSQCLKLYCDCFANGEFCYLCNCMNCYNNLGNEEHRQRAIRNCLERNPNAFRPKIGKAKDTGDASVRKHTKGCNCKRSGCLKNYCECYEAKIACSNMCKCVGCRNVEDTMEKKSVRILPAPSFSGSPQSLRKSISSDANIINKKKNSPNTKQAFNYITMDVIEATTQCLLTMANNAEEQGQEEEVTQRKIIEEFGRCLKQIIDCSMKTPTTKFH